MMPANEYVEVRNGGYYMAGTRIGLDVVIHDFRNGRSAEAIFEAIPPSDHSPRSYGTITFILEHSAEIEAYLKGQEQRYEEIKQRYPLPPELIERFERGNKELSSKRG